MMMMSGRIKLVIAACLILAGVTTLLFANRSRPSVQKPVVLELFTSQGCSSCPAADRLLPRLASAHAKVITLSFHVDYWDSHGWKDPFSNKLYTQRQEAYAAKFNLGSIYTPQLVVNGEREMVGSNAAAAEKTIREELSEPVTTQLRLADVEKTGNKVGCIVRIKGSKPGDRLIAVCVQSRTQTNIRRGENQGISLDEINVVRALSAYPAAPNVQVFVDLPQDLTGAWQLVVLLQDPQLKILDACVADHGG